MEYSIDFFKLQDDKATLTAKLITGIGDTCEATADRIKNKRYEIRLNHNLLKNSEEELLKAIFHEMTHVKQFIKDGLRLNTKVALWLNEPHPIEDYWFSPWEMEARAMETPMWHLFIEST